jgi:DNA-binding NarL/FixJ family response regulator
VSVDHHRRILRVGLSGSSTVTGGPLRIVIVEDDDGLAVLVRQLLTADGRFAVVGRAADGDTAVRLAAELEPDIVLMDLGLPGCDGLAATRAIHARNAAQHVVVYTGSGEFADVARSQDAGAVGFLHKDALASPDLPEALHVVHANYLADAQGPADAL